MAIRVKHGEADLGALVQLAALAGAAQAEAPQVPSVFPQGAPRVGGGGGGRRYPSRAPRLEDYGRIKYPTAGERMAETKTQQMEIEKKMRLQEEARQAAVPVDFKYTAKQKAEIARLQNAKQDLLRNNRLTDVEKQLMGREIDAQIDSILPTGIPRDPSAPQYPPGHGPGDTFQEPDGSWYTVTPEGEKKLLVRYDQTREYVEQKAARDKELKLLDIRHQITKTPIGPPDNQRLPEKEDVDRMMAVISGDVPEYGTPEEEELLRQRVAELKQAPQVANEAGKDLSREFIGRNRMMGVSPGRDEEDLPIEVANAQAFLKEMRRRKEHGERLSSGAAQAIKRAKDMLRRHNRG